MSDVLVDREQDYNFADHVDYEVINTQEQLDSAVEFLSKEILVAVDTENSGIDPHSGWPILLQIGTSDKCFVFPGWRKDLDLSGVGRILESHDILKILFNAKYDWKWIRKHYGFRINNLYCCQVVERLLTVGLPNARRRPALKDLTNKYFGIKLAKDVRSGFINRNPETDPITKAEYAYSAGDVVLLPDIYYQQLMQVMELGLHVVVDMENRVVPALAEAELAGVLLDQNKWRELLAAAETKHREISNRIYSHFNGVLAQKTLFNVPTFNIGSQPQLLKNLAKLGFNLPDTEEGTLKRYKNKHKVFSDLLEWRGVQKIVSSYGEKLLARINKNTERLHSDFNQLEADSGRMSASNPNLQQIPGYDKDDPNSLNFRSCFVSRAGYKLITADYSQQELRILADLSGDPTFKKVYTELDAEGRSIDVHRYTAHQIFNVPYEEVSDSQRKRAKPLNFLLVYGGGAFTLSETLNCTEEEAQEIIDAYFARYTKIKYFLDSSGASAVSKGLSSTISGRIRHLSLPSPDDPQFERAKKSVRRRGMNNPIQGGAADVTKMGLVFLYERLLREGYDATVLMVVHDEFVVEVKDDQAEAVAKIVEEEMVHGFFYFFKDIPMVVDAHISNYWEK